MQLNKQDIVNGSKVLAEYLGWKYIPFSSNMISYKSGGWYKYKTPSNLEASGLKKSRWIKVEEGLIAKFICRTHSELRFFNDWNDLALVIEKLEKEDLSFAFYEWESKNVTRSNFEGIEIDITTKDITVWFNLTTNPPLKISEERKELPKKQQLFFALVDSVKYINSLRNV